jgi:predicted nucleic acid-binding protein
LLVVDASAAVEFLLGDGERARWATRQLLAEGVRLNAPSLIDYEVASSLRRHVLFGGVTTGRAADALHDLVHMRLTRHPTRQLLPRIWELKETLTSYDGAYVALAELLECPLVTTDERLARSHGHAATVLAPPAAD